MEATEETIVEELLKVLRSGKFPLDSEKSTQRAIEARLKERNYDFVRECKLGQTDIPDFMVAHGVVIEVKIKNSSKPRHIFRQCERYCEYSQVKHLILVTNRAMGFPEQINGVPCYVVNMGKSWI